MTTSPAGVEEWRQFTALFGAADWETGVLAEAVVEADDAGDAGAAVAGDVAAAARLGVAGVVAVRAAGQLFEVEEAVDGWILEPSSGTPDVADVAMAAAIRAAQLAAQRRRQEWR